jgi:hypothetical protein
LEQSKTFEEAKNQLLLEKLAAETAKSNAEKRIKSFQA